MTSASTASTTATGTGGPRRRHGRTPARQSRGDAEHRRRTVRLAVLPAGVTAAAGVAAVAYVMTAGSGAGGPGASAHGTDGVVLWSVLGGALLLVCGVILGAARSADAQARDALERRSALRRSVARGQSDIRALVTGLERGERPRVRPLPALPEPGAEADAFELLTHELARAQHAAETAVTDAVALVRSSTSGSEEKVEVFVNLARRLQSLVHREIELLDELENQVEDPDLLKGLFHVDHLATRIRRHAENLAVLGGAVSRRQWSRPVTMTEVLRSSIAEVEHYPRVKLVPPIEGTLRGHAVADVIHLLAELVENATVFSSPQTQVLLRAQHVTAGLAIEVEDRGLGMPAPEQNRMNAVLSDPERIDVGELLRDGRIGLFVVSALAQRHGIVVQLQSNIYGGIQAVLVLPREVLGEEPAAAEQPGADAAAAAGAGANGADGDPETVRARRVRTETARAPQPHTRPQAQDATGPGGAGPSQARPETRPAPEVLEGPHRSRSVFESRPLPERSAYAPAPAPSAPESPFATPSSSMGRPGPMPHPQALPQRPGRAADGARGERPELPRRRRQEHLAPELREAPPARGGESSEADWDVVTQGHDPDLMAAFQRGASLAEESGRTTGDTGTPGTRPAG